MTFRTKLYLALVGAFFLLLASYSLWTNHQIRELETNAEQAIERAEVQERRANELEASGRKYEEKIAYLEANLAELRDLAWKQDEELKNIETNTGNARRDVERARRVRAAAATAEDVCRKLAELGHGCQ
jgi:CHASE3 domain sensor protein